MSKEGKSHLAIVPAYNEATTVSQVVQSISQHQPEFDVLVVDDGSTDETAALARASGASVARHPFNLGIGGAVQTGFLFASANGYDYVVQVDGDGQHDSAEIAKLIETMQANPQIDVVCGSRFIEDLNYVSSRARRIGIRIFSFLLSRIVGRRVTDPTSGFRLYNRVAIELFARDYPHDYPEVEAVLMVHSHQLNMCEIPVRMFNRLGGVSSINPTRSIYYMIKVLLAIGVGLVRRQPTVQPGDKAAVTAG